MGKSAKLYVMCAVLAAGTACNFVIFKDSPDKAAAGAVEFAKAAFVERDVDKAYGLLDPELQTDAFKQTLSDYLRQINSPTSPSVVTATEYESVPGEAGIAIYLIGSNGGESFYYRIPMKGSDRTGYKVAGLSRNQGPFPPSASRKPLPTKLSTGG